MSLTQQVANLAVRMGTEFKTVRSTIGTLASLTTTEKGSIVGAVNEIKATVAAGGTVTVDAITDAGSVGKASLRATTQAAGRSAIGAGTSNLALGTTSSTAKAGDYVPSWSEVSGKPVVIAAGADQAAARAAIGAGTSSLVIGTTSSTAKAGDYVPTWSEVTSKPAFIAAGADAAAARSAIGAQSAADVDARITSVVGGASAAMDTLGEIEVILNNNGSQIGTIVTGLSKRVSVEGTQNFTETEKAQARTNIDVYSKAEIGTPETNFVTVFEGALV